MNRSPFWIVFLSLFMITVLGYTTHTLIKVWQYARLNEQTKAMDIEWTVIPQSDESFIPFAHYSFIVHGKKYHGQTRWQESYLNQWAAEEAVVRLKKKSPFGLAAIFLPGKFFFAKTISSQRKPLFSLIMDLSHLFLCAWILSQSALSELA